MKITEHLKNAKSTLFSIEILPPLKGQGIQSLFDHLDPLMEFNPPFVDVTYHREEYVYKDRGNGLLEKRSIKKRPGTVGICSAIKNKYNVDPVPHIICGGFTKEETENALIDLNFLDIDNVLVIRGDAIKTEGAFIPEKSGHNYAIELLDQVVNMNQGLYLDEDLQNASHTDFCIGVAGYPEKHFEAPNLKFDLSYLKKKAEMGADYIVTQMFYDNQRYFEFVEKCRAEGIEIPIIPGLKPITTIRQNTILPRIFHIDIPEELSDEIEKCQNNAQVVEVGVEWAVKQSKELIEFGVPCLHFYSMGKAEPVRKIAEMLF
ncbi:MAG: methylenetetrahydrofolate reductase [NAD(P)H] [Cyclobacteriaceae bacterium]|nr:methylenetetrahydrofolate reductase [NAD(P)H] [Cyclobacteriaceae bacterium]